MPKVMFDKKIKLDGVKYSPNQPKEVNEDTAQRVVQRGGWIIFEDEIERVTKGQENLKDDKPLAKEMTKEELIEDLMENNNKRQLLVMSRDLALDGVSNYSKRDLAEAIVEDIK